MRDLADGLFDALFGVFLGAMSILAGLLVITVLESLGVIQ